MKRGVFLFLFILLLNPFALGASYNITLDSVPENITFHQTEDILFTVKCVAANCGETNISVDQDLEKILYISGADNFSVKEYNGTSVLDKFISADFDVKGVDFDIEDCILIKATIVEHREFKSDPYTYLNRVTVLDNKGSAPELAGAIRE